MSERKIPLVVGFPVSSSDVSEVKSIKNREEKHTSIGKKRLHRPFLHSFSDTALFKDVDN